MADCFFPQQHAGLCRRRRAAATGGHPLHLLLSLSYPTLAERFLHAALHLKQKVVNETCNKRWRAAAAAGAAGDFTICTGALGTAFLLFRAYRVTADRADLATCAEIVATCDAAFMGEE
ncbi:hypothetical protein E2562_025273 [Oryza meyeriana var. granulata]|uniref:Uncharacterized protein n=1 Tax=Oryza meyeriana var. granulata TaxID=110450 RepID=A0A6G1BZX1_9ORYZ|nr:hypothetical protein E2562_025273 [Oryza meyeriana var. granulata]